MAKKQAGSGSVLGRQADYFGAEEIILPSYGASIVFCSGKVTSQIALITYSGGMDFAPVYSR